MKQIGKLNTFFWFLILLTLLFNCSENGGQEPAIPKVTLSADKTTIKANHKDHAVFTVNVDGKAVTAEVTITQKGATSPLEGLNFSTDSVASYTFYATYHNIKSNEISIEAIPGEVVIVASHQQIKANNKDVVTFSVLEEGEDVTASAAVYQADSPDIALTAKGFSTGKPGTYTFYAMVDHIKSNEIQIEANAVIVTLSIDKTSIKANNQDKAIFTVDADGENVTAAATIMMKKEDGDEVIDGHEFVTDNAGTCTFYAVYEDIKSNEVTLQAEYVALTFLKGYMVANLTSTICKYCPSMNDELETFRQKYPRQIHVIAFHLYGKYCFSDLAGVLAQTAVSMADKVNVTPPPPPLAIFDLYAYSYLWTSTTQKKLTEAFDKAQLMRDRVSLTGMALKSKVEGSLIEFEVRVKTIQAGDYRFFAFILEDGVIHRQTTIDGFIPDYVNNNVATYQLPEGEPFMGVSLGTVRPGTETIRSFAIDTAQFNVGRNVNIDNCRIVCYTLRTKDGSNYIVDNVTECSVKGSVSYLYEK